MDSVQYPLEGYRPEAEAIYDAGKEVVITTLLAMEIKIKELEQKIPVLEKKIASLSKNSSNSSKPPSSDKPWDKKAKRSRPVTVHQKQGMCSLHRNCNRSPGMQEGKLTGVGHRENSVPAQIRRGGYFWRRAGREGVAG